jgi:hypothetical protein
MQHVLNCSLEKRPALNLIALAPSLGVMNALVDHDDGNVTVIYNSGQGSVTGETHCSPQQNRRHFR